MRNILAFGDSNTYGYRPEDGGRYSFEERWTGILAERLKARNCRLIEEGLAGRTTVFEDSVRPGRKGSDFLIPLIESHGPVDTLILMLGTNDCKSLYKASAQVIGLGIEKLIKQAKQIKPDISILLISPIHLGEGVWEDGFDPEFDSESVATSKRLKDVYRHIAEIYNCQFLAASDYAEPSEADREHLTIEGHKILADVIYSTISA